MKYFNLRPASRRLAFLLFCAPELILYAVAFVVLVMVTMVCTGVVWLSGNDPDGVWEVSDRILAALRRYDLAFYKLRY
jgi:Ni,Fe-hydrogenase I cytochrome b subunit